MKVILSILLSVVAMFRLSAADYRWPVIDSRFDSVAAGLEAAVFQDKSRRSFAGDVNELYSIAESSGNKVMAGRARYWDAYRLAKEHLDSAESLVSSACVLSDSASWGYDHCRFSILKADIARMKGRWAEAYNLYVRQIPLLEKAGDRFWLAKVYVALGAIWLEVGERNSALEHYSKGDSIFREINCEVCQTKNRINICNVLYMLGGKAEAVEILNSLKTSPIARADTGYMVNVLISLYSVSDGQDSMAPREAYRLVNGSGDPQLQALTLLTMGNCLAAENKPDSAIICYNEALRLTRDNDSRHNLVLILKGLSDAFAAKGEVDSAYRYMKLYDACRDENFSHEEILGLNRLESRATMERIGAEIRGLQEDKRHQRQIAVVVFVAVTLIFTLVCWLLWLSRRKTKAEKQLLEAENREQAMLNNAIRLELDSKTRELTSNAMVVARNSALLKDLSGRIDELRQGGDIAGEEGNRLKRQIDTLLSADNDWNNFKIHFDQVHPDFFARLKERFPNLSKNELRLCAYIRLNMNTKEIAQLLSVQPDTVNTSRYRLRKKMGLPPQSSLDDFLMAL